MLRYRMIDLFAGIGGIRLGFDRAFRQNAKTIFASEVDFHARVTYEQNFTDDFCIVGDITEIKEHDVPQFDICLAGFPCQAFSIAGKKDGFNDNYYGNNRGNLFLEVVRICAYHKPKVIFCENVKGLVIHDSGNTFKTICDSFRNIGYRVHYKILNSKDFGLAQNRERIYIVCFRNDINDGNFHFPKPSGTKSTLLDVLEEAPISSKYYLSSRYVETLRRHKKRHQSAGNGFGYVIRDLNGIAGALVCGGMGREKNLIIDTREHSKVPVTRIVGEINDENIRKLTPREWARLQGFPDDYVLPVADTHLYKQLGNTVSVNVIEAVAFEIKDVLNENFCQ